MRGRESGRGRKREREKKRGKKRERGKERGGERESDKKRSDSICYVNDGRFQTFIKKKFRECFSRGNLR